MSESSLLSSMQERLLDSAKDTLYQLSSCWHEMYDMDEEKVKMYVDKFMFHTNTFLKEMLDSQLEKLTGLRNDITYLMTEKSVLERDLNVKILLNENDAASRPLSGQKEYLEKLLKNYLELRDKRISEMNKLMAEVKMLCQKMGKDIPVLTDKPVPSEDDLILIRSEVMNLDEEKSNRLDILRKIRSKIITIISELELPQDSVEDWDSETKSLLLSDDDDWPLSTSNIQLMQEHLLEMQIKLDEAKTQRGELMSKLQILWNRIREDKQYQNDFTDENNYYGSVTFKKIKTEIERCMSIRKQKLKPLTDNVRTEIIDLWDKITLIQEERKQFKGFNIDVYTEELLEQHEKFLSDLKAYYEKYKVLFSLMNERTKLWSAWVKLETRALDKNRFNNRGGQLLKEEKERKLLARKIPKIESDILEKIQVHLDAEGKPFLWHGQEPKEIITSDHKELEIFKEQQKTSKKEDIQKGPGSAKRKLPPTPDIKVNKILKKTAPIPRAQQVLNQTVTLSSATYTHVFSSPIPTPTSHPKEQEENIQSCESLASMASYSEFHAKLHSDTPRRPFEDVNQGSGSVYSSPAGVAVHSPSKTKLKSTPKPWPQLNSPRRFPCSPRP